MAEYFQLIHPRIVHFPIALIITALGLDLFSLLFKKESVHKTAIHIYIIAVLITPVVVQTGIWEQTRLHLNHPILTLHRTLGYWTMWVLLGSLPILYFCKLQFPRLFRGIFFALLVTLAVLVSFTAHNGGRMVYEYGTGVAD